MAYAEFFNERAIIQQQWDAHKYQQMLVIQLEYFLMEQEKQKVSM
jgi:hypothetical protein